MKSPHPLPLSAASGRSCAGAVAASVFLLSPPARVWASTNLDENDLPRKKHGYERDCVPMLKMANRADADGSGGLSRTEFARFWNGLGGIQGGGADLVPSASNTYGYLLCQCSYTFDYPIACCDGKNFQDDESPVPPTEASRWYPPEVWSEVSLWKFGEYPDKTTKHYHKQFCEYVEWAMKTEGLQVNLNGALESLEPTVATLVSATSTAAATTTTAEKETITTKTTEKPTTTKPPTTTTTTTTSTEEEATTTVTDEAVTTKTETLLTGQVNTTEPPDSADDSTINSATATVTTAGTAATYSVTTITIESTISTLTETVREPVVLSFLGSTNGNVDAESLNMEEVNHAVWTVGLDVLEDMGLRTSGGRLRQLMGTFAEEISLYFESVVISVDDVDCPKGLSYAEEEAPCLKFTYTLSPKLGGNLGTSEQSDSFAAEFRAAANEEGDLYEALIKEHPDTDIVGLGSPGGGIPFEKSVTSRAVALNADDTTVGGVQGSGFPVGGAVGIALAMALLLAIAVAVVARQRRRDRARKLDDSGLSEDIEANEVNADAEWFDEEVDERGRGSPIRLVSPAASSLAAMGVAGTAAARLSMRRPSAVTETAPMGQCEGMPMVAARLSTGETEVMIADRQA